MVNVGEYTSPVDAMGFVTVIMMEASFGQHIRNTVLPPVVAVLLGCTRKLGLMVSKCPWTPKPRKMKVLNPQYMGYNP